MTPLPIPLTPSSQPTELLVATPPPAGAALSPPGLSPGPLPSSPTPIPFTGHHTCHFLWKLFLKPKTELRGHPHAPTAQSLGVLPGLL